MKYNFKEIKFQFSIILTLLITIQFAGYSQIVGGRSNSESSPKKVEASKLNGGDFVGDVNLLNGSYNATVPLGTVSTPGGISFSLALQYSSAFSIGGTKPVCSGIPYGEGWDLNLPTISVQSDVFHNFLNWLECEQNEDNNIKLTYGSPFTVPGSGTPAQVINPKPSDEGDLFWFSPMINIPGVASGRAIFKYVDVADAGAVVFVLNKFESPVEIRYYGNAWKITLADGTQYVFDMHLSNYRAPSNKRILDYDQGSETDDITNYPAYLEVGNTIIRGQVNGNISGYSNKEAIRNVIEAKESYSVWYCSVIRNLNTPLQGVRFEYKGFGNFNYFQEFQQSGYGNVSQEILGSTTFSFKPNFETYSELLLVNVSSFVMESPVDILELDYKTLNEALNYSSSHYGGLINIQNTGDNSIGIFDSLYSFQYIYSTEPGQNASSFQSTHNFNNWLGYQHRKAESPFSDFFSSNPYLSSSNSYKRKSYSNGLSQIQFNHSFLESPRITPENMYPGDIYQVTTKINRSTSQSIKKGNGTIDISIVTGNCDNHVLTHNNLFSSIDGQNSGEFSSNLYEKTRGVEIFSTFNMALKWQMQYNANTLETSNYFVMPNIPTSFGGLNIQVGPGNSDLDYSRNVLEPTHNMLSGIVDNQFILANKAYPFYKVPFPYRVIKSSATIGHNFGIGLPWGMMLPVFNNMALGLGSLHGDLVYPPDLYNMWWYNTQTNNDFENIPTKFGAETSLKKVELKRYTKNPYMLQAVRLYHFNGEMDDMVQSGKKIVSQKKLEYKFESERIIENYDYAYEQIGVGTDLPIIYGPSNKTRTIILLEKVIEVPLNGNLLDADFGVIASDLLITKLGYLLFFENISSTVKYDQTRPFKGHQQYLLQTFTDHLGAITRVTFYDAISNLTKMYNNYSDPHYCDGIVTTSFYGKDEATTIHPVVKYIDKNDENNYLIPSAYPGNTNPSITNPSLLKRWEYIYEGTIYGRKDYVLPYANFRTNNSLENDFVGYKRVTVLNPKLSTGEQNRTEYEYNGSIVYGSSSIEDYLFSGKMKSVKTYTNTNVLHDEKIINYGFTLAFQNGYERPNFMRERLVLDGYLFGRSYEYEDIYKNKVLTVDFSGQTFTGPAAYSYIVPPYIRGGFTNFETPKMLEFFFYEDLRALIDPLDHSKFSNPEYMFHSYFIKKTDEINRVYENSLSKNAVIKVHLPHIEREYVTNPFGGGIHNPIPWNPNRDVNFKSSIDKGTNGIFEKLLHSAVSDEVLVHFIGSKNYTTIQKYEVLGKQNGLSNKVWIEVVNIQNQFTPDQLKQLINIQPYFSDEILQKVIEVATIQTDSKIYEEFLLKNEYLSDPIRIELTKSIHESPGESFVNIFQKQPDMSSEVLKSVVNSNRLTDVNLVSILKNQPIPDELFLKIVKNERFTQKSISDLFAETIFYPSDNVLLEVLNKGSQYSDVSYQKILEASPNELSDAVKSKITQVLSVEMVLHLKPALNANNLNRFCGSAVINDRKFIETKTSYEYYEADYTGKSIGRAYNVLLAIDEAPRTLDGDEIVIGSPTSIGTIVVDKLLLKHEPSWQVFSTKTTSPHLPGGFSQEEYFYLFDLQNRYDRYWFNYDYDDPAWHFQPKYISVGTGVTQVSDIYVHNNIFPLEYSGSSGDFPMMPPFDGMKKSRAYGLRTLAFQKTSFSKNQHDIKPMSRSEYYMYDSRWEFNDIVYSETHEDSTIPCSIPIATNPCPDGDLLACTDCYGAKFIDWEYMLAKLPFGYCIWHTGSMELGSYWYCPSGTDVHSLDPTAELVYCSGFDVSLDDQSGIIPAPNPEATYYGLPKPKQLPIGNTLGKTLQLRSVTIQVDETSVSDATDPFITHRMSPKNTYVAEFTIGGSNQRDENDFRNPYSMVFPYKTLTVRKILERNRYLQPKLEINQMGLKTRYDYSVSHRYWNINSDCIDAGLISNSYSSIVNQNIGLPLRITIGEFEAGTLISDYEYNEKSLIKKITDQTGKTTEYTYDNFNRLLTITENGTKLLSTFDYKTWDNDDDMTFLERTNQNYVLNTINNSSTVGDQEIVKSFVDPLGRNHSTVDSYTDELNLTRQIHSGTLLYDNWGRVTNTFKNYLTTGSSINATASTTTPFMQNQYENDPKGRVDRASNFGVNIVSNNTVKTNYFITNYIYTSCELGLTKSELEMIMGTGNITNYQFFRSEVIDQDDKHSIDYKNAIGQQVATLKYDNGSKILTLFGYDSYGNLTKVINPDKQVTDFEFNMLGQLVKEKSVDAGTKRYMYNKQGLISIMQDETGRTNLAADNSLRPYYHVYEYDIFGQLRKVGRTGVDNPYIYHQNSPYAKVYDALYYETEFIGESLGVKLYLELDDYQANYIYFDYKYSTASTQDWLCRYDLLISVHPDDNDNLDIQTHTPLDHFYDIVNMEKEYAYYSNTGVHTQGKLAATFSYNNAGKKVQRVDFNYIYGQISEQTIQFNATELIELNPTNNIISKIEYPSYNYRGSLLEEKVDVNADGIIDIHYVNNYDKLNRLKSISASMGELVLPTDATLLVSYEYNDATGAMSKKKHFIDGRLDGASILNYMANEILYSFDSRDRLIKINSKMGVNNVMEYKIKYDNQDPNPYTNNPLYSPVNFTPNYNGNINGTSMRYDFSNLAISNPANLNIFSTDLVYGYAYDDINRLVDADATVLDFVVSGSPDTYKIGDESYSYDRIGNITTLLRTLKNDDPTPGASLTKTDHFSYQYTNGNNRLEQVNGFSGTPSRHYTYDVNGNLLTDDFKHITATKYGRASYPYEIETPDEKINYLYDVNDMRVYKKVDPMSNAPEKEEYYLQDVMGRSLAIFDMENTEWSYFVFGGEREARIIPIGTQKPGVNIGNTDKQIQLSQATYFIYDHLGNTRITYTPKQIKDIGTHDNPNIVVMSQINNVVDYFPYGKIVRQYADDQERYLTTQHERDGETGLDYRGARYYDSDVARFLSVDPMAEKFAGWSSYNYCMGNPVNFIDKNGKWPTWIHNRIIRKAFKNVLTKAEIKTLQKASAYTDSKPGAQAPESAPEHYMSSPGQNKVEAAKLSEAFILQKKEEFKAKTGNEALFSLGEGMHTIMDKSSPSHEGSQEWGGTSLRHPLTILKAIVHVVRELNVFWKDEDKIKQAVNDVQEYHKTAEAEKEKQLQESQKNN